MSRRKIIRIDEEKCNGCGLCIPNCPEGALQIIDGKARLINDLFCDGLGACIGHCPEGAIEIEEREAEEYDERKVMKNIIKQGKNVIKAHLIHLKEHNQFEFLKEAIDFLKEKNIEIPIEEALHEHAPAFSGCPGSRVMDLGVSQLRQWPVQIKLVPSYASYFKDADLLIAADCVPFAYPDFHDDLLRGKILLVGCPKLDDAKFYEKKITQILKENNIKSITCTHMEVPCCFGLVNIVKNAIRASGNDVPFSKVILGIKGDKK